MIWKQWDIAEFDFPDKSGPHPVVVVSPNVLAAGAKTVNVLFCTSQRQTRSPKSFEVLLDEADGLDWETFCCCDILFSVSREALKSRPKPGLVTRERRRQIGQKINAIFGFLSL